MLSCMVCMYASILTYIADSSKLLAPGQFLGLTRGSECVVGLYPVDKQLFRIFMRTAMLNML